MNPNLYFFALEVIDYIQKSIDIYFVLYSVTLLSLNLVVIINNFLCLFHNYLHESENVNIYPANAELMGSRAGARGPGGKTEIKNGLRVCLRARPRRRSLELTRRRSLV